MPSDTTPPMPLPDIVTHYSRSQPFRSVTAAGPERWADVVAQLNDGNVWGRGRFDDPHYLTRRTAVEARMHAELLRRGGAPRIAHPYYGLLGRDERWERNGNQPHEIPLASIPPGCVTVTVGDSLLSWDPDYRAEVEARDGPMHPLAGRLLFPDELSPDLPRLEVQLWFQPSLDATDGQDRGLEVAPDPPSSVEEGGQERG